MLDDTDVKLGFENGTQCVYLNLVRRESFVFLSALPEISMGASKVSAIPMVREYLLTFKEILLKE